MQTSQPFTASQLASTASLAGIAATAPSGQLDAYGLIP